MGNDKIKVLHIDTEKTWRGGQQQAVYLFEGMLAHGYDTCMVCQPGSAMETYCINNHLPYFSLAFSHELDYKAGKALAKFARSYGASILQLHTGHSVSWGLWAKLFFGKLKLVATRRVDFSIKKNPLSALKYSTKLLDQIVCISHKIRNVMLNDGIPSEKLSVIHSGINIRRIPDMIGEQDIRLKLGIPETSLIIGTVAAFAGHKDYPNFINAASLVLNQRPDVRFIAVGDGELFDQMNALAEDLSILDKLFLTGFQSNVSDYLKAFDIFVLASKKEGLGTSVLDAMSIGLPIIGTQAGGIPEMLEDGINGLLVPPQDSESLAKAIIKLIDNPELRKEIGIKALTSVQKFDIADTVTQYLKLYNEMSRV